MSYDFWFSVRFGRLPDALGRPFNTAFSSKLGPAAAKMNQNDGIGVLEFSAFYLFNSYGTFYTHFL